MDNYGNTRESIFDFGIDETAKEHLRESAKWGKFLAIVSFISFGLILLFALGALLLAQGAEQTGVFVGYTIVALLYFYPMWTLYKFSSLSKQAVNTGNQQQLTEAFRHLKNMLKFLGIVTIIGMALVGLSLVFGVIIAGMTGA